MPARARLGIAAAIALLSAAGIGIIVTGWVSGGDHAAVPFERHERAAVAPFAGYREAVVKIAGRCARVVVADTAARRERGLRGASDLGPYAGMLFAQPTDTNVAFTMSEVAAPLDIAWFTSAGALIASRRMHPCPHATAGCPVYRSPRPYRFAVETPAGTSARVTVSPCV